MTTTDEARVTDEEIAMYVAKSRDAMYGAFDCKGDRVTVALADRLAARDAERAEVVALLEATAEYQSLAYCDGAEGDEPISDECYDEPPCWSHRAAALLAKLKDVTP